MVLLIFLFFLLCIGLPLGEVSRVTLGLSVSFTLVDIFVLFGAVVWVLLQLKKKQLPKSLQSKSFLLVIGIFILSLFVNVSTLNKEQFFVAGLYIVRFASLGIIFFMVRDASTLVKKKIPLLLLVSGGFLVLSGYVQYFFYPSLRNLIYFGWDEHFYRMFGTFFDPNFFGLFLVLFFLFLLSKLFNLSVQKEKIQFAFLFLFSSITFIAIFLTYSRTALLALVVGLVILFWNRNFWKWLGVFLISIVILTGVFFIVSTKTKDVNSLFRTVSTDARIGSAKNALTIFIDHPILGVGFNAYRYAQYRYRFMIGSPIQEDHGASGADASLFLVLATSGIIGFLVFCFFLFVHTKSLITSKKSIGLATFGAFFVGSFFVNGLFYPFLLTWVWIILGLTESDV